MIGSDAEKRERPNESCGTDQEKNGPRGSELGKPPVVPIRRNQRRVTLYGHQHDDEAGGEGVEVRDEPEDVAVDLRLIVANERLEARAADVRQDSQAVHPGERGDEHDRRRPSSVASGLRVHDQGREIEEQADSDDDVCLDLIRVVLGQDGWALRR